MIAQNDTLQVILPNPESTASFGVALAPLLGAGMVVFLEGELGAGKTTLVRSILRGKGHTGPVKSPTYALVEVYPLSRLYLYHFDFYRFTSPEELLDAGLDEYFRSDSVCIIEWPQNAATYLPPADLCIRFHIGPLAERQLVLSAHSPEGVACLNTLRHLPALHPLMGDGASS